MNVRLLRNEKNWSQEQLAHFSGLSIRTIQRIENNEKVGLESLKSLAAVFEIDLTQLTQIKQDNKMSIQQQTITPEVSEPKKPTLTQQEQAEKYVVEVKNFYKVLFSYGASFLIWPIFALIDEAENNDMWWLTLYMGCFYLILIGIHANNVFQPFGEKWQKKQQQKYLDNNK